MCNLAIFASHNGSSIDPINAAIKSGRLKANLCLIITNNSNAPVLQKAKLLNIPSYIINDKTCQNVDTSLTTLLNQYNCTNIFLAGYMKKISSQLTKQFRIINSHPSLLPKFGGKGMYGRFVHNAVIAHKELQSGVTIHYVNENYDEGAIILQQSISIVKDETPLSLENKIKALEKKVIVEALCKCLN